MEALVFSAWVSVDAMDGEGGRLGGGLSEVDVGGWLRGVVSSKRTEKAALNFDVLGQAGSSKTFSSWKYKCDVVHVKSTPFGYSWIS
jgi:hypothetical protein